MSNTLIFTFSLISLNSKFTTASVTAGLGLMLTFSEAGRVYFLKAGSVPLTLNNIKIQMPEFKNRIQAFVDANHSKKRFTLFEL